VSGRENFYIRDLTLFAMPMKAYMTERLASAELPLWTPHVSAGMPFLADIANQVFYPLNVIFAVISPVREALTWFVVVHDLLAMIAFYWLCRSRGHSRGVAVWGGLAYGLTGYVLSITDNVNLLPAVAWVPAALAAHSLAIARRSAPLSAVSALCLAAIVLAGDLMNAALAWALLLFLCVEAAAKERAAGGMGWVAALRSPVARLATATILTAMITAVQVLPAVELTLVSTRDAGLAYEEVSKWSFPVARVIELVQPFFFAANYPTFDFLGAGMYPRMGEPWANSVYVGTLTVLLALLGIATGARRAIVWLVVLVAALLMSFGANAPYHRPIVESLPLLATQRYPEKLLYWVTLAVCMLAVGGAQWLLDPNRTRFRAWPGTARSVKAALSIAVPVLAVWVLAYLPARAWIWEQAHLSPHVWSMRLPVAGSHFQVLALHTLVVFAMVAALLWVVPDRRRLFAAALLGVAIADLAWVHYRFVPTAPDGLFAPQETPYALRQLDSQGRSREMYRVYFDVRHPGRDVNYARGELAARTASVLGEDPLERGYIHAYAMLFRRDRLQVNSGVLHGVEYLNGRMSPLQPTRHLAVENYLLARAPARLMVLANVRYVVTSLQPASPLWKGGGFALRHTDGERNLRILEVESYLPRALVVPNAVRASADLADTLAALANVEDPRRTVVVSQDVEARENAASGATMTLPQVELSRPSPELYVARGMNPFEHAWLLVNESHFDGWRATVNGAPAELLRANGRFMAVPIERGAFEATLNYRSTFLAAGAAVSIFGLVAGVWLLAGAPAPGRLLSRAQS